MKNIYFLKHFFAFAFTVVLFSSCGKPKPSGKTPIEVTAVTVEPRTIPAIYTFVGVAQSSHLVEIFSRVEGYLWKIAYTEGSFVKAGDQLFQIDPRQFEAAVVGVNAELERHKAILWAAEKSVQRYKPLYEQKAASQRDLDNAIAHQLASEASVEATNAKLIQAELNLSYTDIKSPIDGLTGRSKFREGTLITPNVNGLLTYVAVVDPIWVIFSISDSYILSTRAEISKNRLIPPENNNYDVFVTLSDGSEFPYVGKVNFASPILDSNTGTMTVRAVFPNPDKTLRPGQFVRAIVKGAMRPNAITVPQQCVQQGAKGMYVYVVNTNQIASMRYVEVGDWHQNEWIIHAGLKEGDRVIVSGVNKVSEGVSVTVAQEPLP